MYKRILVSVSLLFFVWSAVNAQDDNSKIDDIKSVLINGDYKVALSECKALIKSGVNDTTQLATVYGYAGLSSEALGHKTEAINYYKKAVELQMPQLDVYDKLINLTKKEKNDSIYEFALLEKNKAFPEYNQEVTKSLAYLYINSGQFKKLLNCTNDLLDWFPENENYNYFNGVALENLNNTEEAKQYYEKALKLNPDHSGANMSLGLILYNEGSEIFANRKKEYESKSKPDRVDYLTYNRGIEKGKVIYRKALPHLLKAYESGSYPGLKQVLFNTYARLEEKEKKEAYR